MRFFHIIKTGGETLELHLAQHPSPRLDYAHCRRAGRASGWQRNLSALASAPCALSAAGVSAALCALNCECCAEDSIESGLAHGGSFHGTLLRSPRVTTLASSGGVDDAAAAARAGPQGDETRARTGELCVALRCGRPRGPKARERLSVAPGLRGFATGEDTKWRRQQRVRRR